MTVIASTPILYAAQNYDLKEITPEVRQAIENRKARYGELARFKQQGLVGETNGGYAEVIGDSGEAGAIVAGENQDRRMIYETIASQNDLGPAGLSEVHRIFAEVQRGKAQSGDPIQLPSGEWIKKE